MGLNIFLEFRDDDRLGLFFEVAKLLKKKQIVDKIGAAVTGYEGFEILSETDELSFDQLVCEAKVYNQFTYDDIDIDNVRRIEGKYGNPTLSLYTILASRFHPDESHDFRTKLVYNWFIFYEDLFERFQPDIFLTDDVGQPSKAIPFTIVNEKWGDSVWWHTTRVGDYHAFSRTIFDRFDEINARYEGFESRPQSQYPESEQQARDYVNEYRKSGKKPDYMEKSDEQDKHLFEYLWRGIRYFKDYYSGYDKNDYTISSPRSTYYRVITSNVRDRYLSNSRIFDRIEDEPFVFFPLHLQPEWSTLVIAQPYRDQITIAERIAEILPYGYSLYVKEHPRMVGNRSLSYYRRLKEIPNVKLIEPFVDSHKIIGEAALTTTITGTAGFESVMLNTPTITFGEPHYHQLPGVRRVKSFDDLDTHVNDMINNSITNQDELINYITAIIEEGFKTQAAFKIPKNAQKSEAQKIVAEFFKYLEWSRNSTVQRI